MDMENFLSHYHNSISTISQLAQQRFGNKKRFVNIVKWLAKIDDGGGDATHFKSKQASRKTEFTV